MSNIKLFQDKKMRSELNNEKKYPFGGGVFVGTICPQRNHSVVRENRIT